MPAPSIYGFSEKVALISGADDPIGRAIAIQLALNGVFVIVGFSDENVVNLKTFDELTQLGTLAHSVIADVSTPSGARALVAEVENMFGRLDFLVNCVRTDSDSGFAETSDDDFDRAVAISAKAVFFVTQSAIALMESRPKPKIVNVVSALDTDESSQNALAALSQHAVIGLTKSLAESLPAKFRVNAVAVTSKKPSTDEQDSGFLRPKAAIDPDDVARTIMFLLSSESIGVTGQVSYLK